MSDYPEIAARFARETASHTMTVMHEAGLYRHLRFEGTADSPFHRYPFELITWPYNLVVKAGWTFHFDIDATPDMFDLFRRTAFTGEINPDYWSEKGRAGRDEIKGFDPELLKAEIEKTVKEWIEDAPGDREVFERELREAVRDHFFSDMAEYAIEYELEAHRALHDFSFRPKGDDSEFPYYFADWHEWRLTDFTPGFLHCCYAIRHGIDLWDAARKSAEVAA